MSEFAIARQCPLYDGVSDPVRIGDTSYVFAAHKHQTQVIYDHATRGLVRELAADVITEHVIWHRGGVLCLVCVPGDLTETRRWWIRAMIRGAADVAALQTVVRTLNEAPPWPE